MVFQTGGRYRNRKGGYEVLGIDDNKLHVRYDTGEEEKLDSKIQARIVKNIDYEEAALVPKSLPELKQNDFFWTLGVIGKKGVLNAEVPPQSMKGFFDSYSTATGVLEIDDIEGLSPLESGGQNKWGSELRVYLPVEITEHQRFILPDDVNLVESYEPKKVRINKNSFWWSLVEGFGFYCGSSQDINRIQSRIPEAFLSDFMEGLNSA